MIRRVKDNINEIIILTERIIKFTMLEINYLANVLCFSTDNKQKSEMDLGRRSKIGSAVSIFA